MTESVTPLAARVAAAVMAVQALILLALVFFVGFLMLAPSSDATNLALWEVVLLGLTVMLLLLARAVKDGRGWARSGTIVWNLLFLPVGWQMLNPAWWYSGVVVLLLAVIGLIAAFRMPPPPR